jgi:hypothetical protein
MGVLRVLLIRMADLWLEVQASSVSASGEDDDAAVCAVVCE